MLLSLQGAEGNRFVPHAALEAWLRESGLSWTFVRASFFMQNLITTHRSDIRDRDEIMVPAGHGATAFVDAAVTGRVPISFRTFARTHADSWRRPAGHDRP